MFVKYTRSNLSELVLNDNLLNETFIYNRDSKIIYNFCTYGGNITPAGGSPCKNFARKSPKKRKRGILTKMETFKMKV